MDSATALRTWTRLVAWAAAGGALLAAVALLAAPADLLVGSPQTDLAQQFLAWRAFAAASWHAGHWPLWNPYTYGGEPFLGGFQSAVFYPPSLMFLVLPLARAVHLTLLLHLAILAAGLYRWARQRGLHPAAAALGGLALALSGPVFPHLYAGHLSNLCTLAWAPWIFAELEAWAEGGSRRHLLIASAAVAMQLLAGHGQYAFYTGIAAGLDLLLWPLLRPAAWRRALPGAVAAYLGGAALAGAQLLPGLAAAAEGLRQSRLDAAFAGQLSLPPENLLTAFLPGLFGGPTAALYWGRGYTWEMSVFLGVSGCLLLGVALADPAHRRPARLGAAVAGGLLLLALGRHTPLFPALYAFGPGLDRFRGWSKFTFPAAVFLALAIAQGADAVFRGRQPRPALPAGAAALGALALAGAGWLRAHPHALAPCLARIRDSGESFLPAATFAAPATLAAANSEATRALAWGGGLALLAGLSLLAAGRRPALRWIVLGLLPVEFAAFAATQFATFRRAEAVAPALRTFVAEHPGDYRVQNLLAPNNGFLLGAADIWGNDPGLLKRYAEFMTFSQGADADRATPNVRFVAPSPLYALLRLRYVFSAAADGLRVYETRGELARVELVSGYRVRRHRDEIFAALRDPDFDPRQTVILETEPLPAPRPAAQAGSCRILASSPDAFTVEAELATPALLLVTDPYSRDWHARALPGSSQTRYAVLPADYVIRATPLGAGRHRIEFRYEPSGLIAGLVLSGCAWLVWLACLWRDRTPAP